MVKTFPYPIKTKVAIPYRVAFVFVTQALLDGKDDVSINVAANYNTATPAFLIHNVQSF